MNDFKLNNIKIRDMEGRIINGNKISKAIDFTINESKFSLFVSNENGFEIKEVIHANQAKECGLCKKKLRVCQLLTEHKGELFHILTEHKDIRFQFLNERHRFYNKKI